MSFDRLYAFEQELAAYTGAPFAVLTDGCTHAIELAFRYYNHKRCEFSAYTYLSVMQTMEMLGVRYLLLDEAWQGEYRFHGTNIWDSARLLRPGMYRTGQVQCLSFGNTKPLHIGKVGAILLDDAQAYARLSCMRSDGRDLRYTPWTKQQIFCQGYHYCPTLEDCERGLNLLRERQPHECQNVTYPDLRQFTIAP
jgi:dTDP-4-amino-4,6-dideoxygalactose transaminase